jgi:Arc/MetJ-type ribon-helix-helix transcriptional regulator
MSQIAVRLSDAELGRLDALVEDGGFATRAEAVRAAIKMLSGAARERRIEAAYATAYEQAPLTDEEKHMLDAAASLAADLAR